MKKLFLILFSFIALSSSAFCGESKVALLGGEVGNGNVCAVSTPKTVKPDLK